MSVLLRELEARDHDTVLALNEASVHFLAPLDLVRLTAILELTSWARAVEVDAETVAFAWAIPHGRPYWSRFYGWFEDRSRAGLPFAAGHLYLDRIVVGAAARRRGIASLLYDDLEAHARDLGLGWVTCEVDLIPRNDPSLAFHTGRGFEPIAELDARPEGPLVQLFAKPLA